ncbi:hypothetical protein H5410_056425 [Solanum commersonii]|uniref:Uncharacterized protein n=1 Tax=Solanum commersonii TaxID=4109 RepID=A0A9J5WK82_SOLCO|nr:hypothetical protein H5410_056425 [Solanum commersonii]
MDLLVIQISDVIFLEIFVDIHQDLSYGAGWSRWKNQPLFKTFAIELVGPDDQTGPFSRSNEPQSDLSYGVDWSGRANRIFSRSKKPGSNLTYGAGWSRRGNQPIFKVKRSPEKTGKSTHFHGQMIPRAVKPPVLPIFVFPMSFCQKISLTFDKTLALESARLDGKDGPFSSSNDPRRRFPMSFLLKFSWTSIKTLAIMSVGYDRQTDPFSRKISWTSIKTLDMESICLDRVKGAPELVNHSFCISYGAGWSQLANRTIFKVKQALKRSVGLAGQPGSFSGSNELWSGFAKFFMDSHQDIRYGVGRSRQENLPIAKVKGAAEWLCSQLVPTGKLDHFQGETSPKAVHGYFGDPDFRHHFCQKFLWMSIKTFAMSWLVPMAKPAHLQGQTSTRVKSIKTLAMDSVGLDGQMAYCQDQMILVVGKPPILPIFVEPTHFRGKTIPEAAKPAILPIFICYIPWIFWLFGYSTSVLPIIFMDIRQDLRYGVGQFCQNISWTSVKTLAMEHDGPNRKTDPFSRTNETRILTSLLLKFFMDVCQDLRYGADWSIQANWIIFMTSMKTLAMESVGPVRLIGHFQVQRNLGSIHGSFDDPDFQRHFCQKFSWMSVKTLTIELIVSTGKQAHFKGQMIPRAAMESIGPDGQTDPFSRSNNPRSGVKGASECVNPSLCQFLCVIIQGYFGDLNFQDVIKTLAMEPVGSNRKTGPFSMSNETRSCRLAPCFADFRVQKSMDILVIQISKTSIKTLDMESIGPVGLIGHFQGQRNIRSAMEPVVQTGKPAHFQGHMIPGAGKPLVLPIITSIKTFVMESIGPNGQIGPFSGSNDPQTGRLVSMIKLAHFHGETNPEAGKPPSMDLLVILIFDVIFAKNFCGHPSRPLLWSGLVTMGKLAHFQGQTSPGASIKTLATEPVGLDRKTDPFSRSSDPRSGRLVPMGKPTHFQIQTISGVDNCVLVQGSFGHLDFQRHFCQKFSWKSIKTLDIEPTLALEMVGPDGKGGPFSSSNDSQNRFSTSFLPNIFMDVRQHLSFGTDWSRWESHPFSSSNDPQSRFFCASPRISWSSRFPTSFLPKILWTSVKTLGKDPVGPDGKIDPFSRSIDHQCRSVNTLAMESIGPDGKSAHFQWSNDPQSVNGSFGDPDFRRHFCQIFSWMFHKALALEPIGPDGKAIPFPSQKDPESMDLLVTQIFDINFAKNFLEVHQDLRYGAGWSIGKWPIVKVNQPIVRFKEAPEWTLAMQLVGPDGQNGPFSWLNETHSSRLIRMGKSAILKVKQAPDRTSVKTLAMKAVFPDGQTGPFKADWSRLANRTIFKVTRAPKWALDLLVIQIYDVIFAKFLMDVHQGIRYRPMDLLVIQISDVIFIEILWTSINTLAMESVGPDGQTGPFSRALLWRQLVPMAKPAHFQGQTGPRACKSIMTLDMESVGLDRQMAYCQDLQCHFCRNFWMSAKILTIESLVSIGKPTHFQGEMSPEDVHGYFGYLNLQGQFCRNVSWTSVKTLVMEPVGPNGKTGPFSRFSMSFLPNFFMDVRQDLSYGSGCPDGPWIIWVIRISDVIFANFFRACPSRHYLWSRLVSTGKPTHFQGRTIPIVVHGSFGDPNFRLHFCQKISWTSVKTLALDQIGLDGQTDPFSRSNDPQSCRFVQTGKPVHFHGQMIPEVVKPSVFAHKSFKTLDMEPVGLDRQMAHCQGQMIPGVGKPPTSVKTLSIKSVGPDWQTNPFSRLNEPRSWITSHFVDFHVNQPIVKVKGSPKSFLPKCLMDVCQDLSNGVIRNQWSMDLLVIQIFDVIFAEIFHGRSSRPLLWSGLNEPRSGSTLVLPIFVCYSLWIFWENRPIFKVKRSPEWVTTPFCRFWCVIVHGPFGDMNLRHHFCQKNSRTFHKTLALKPIGPDGKASPFSSSNNPRSSPGINFWSFRLLTSFLPKNFLAFRQDLRYGVDFRHHFCLNFCMEVRQELSFGAGWSRWKSQPIFKFKRYPVQKSIKTLDMEPIGLDRQMAHCLGQMIPGVFKPLIFDISFAEIFFGHSSRPYLWSRLVRMGKSAIFKFKQDSDQTLAVEPICPDGKSGLFSRSNDPLSGQMSPEVGKPPIFCQTFSWTSGKTLAMESIGPERQSSPFSGSNEPPSGHYGWSWLVSTRKLAHCQEIFVDVNQDLSYVVGWSRQANQRIFKVKQSPKLSMDILVIQIFDVIFAKIFSGLHQDFAMESVGPDGQIGPFSRFAMSFLPKFSWTSVKTLAIESTLTMEPVGPKGKTGPFSRFLTSFLLKLFMDIRQDLSYGARWANWTIFMIKCALYQLNPLFCRFSCAIVHGSFVHGSFGHPDFRRHFCRTFSWTSVKTLAMEPLVPMGKLAHFQSQMSPRASIKTLDMELVDLNRKTDPFSRSNDPRSGFLMSFLLKFFLDICKDLSYVVGWFEWANRPFLSSKKPQIGFSRSFLVKFFLDVHQDLSYGAGWSQRSMDLLVIWIFDVILAKKFRGFNGSFGDPDFRRHFCQNFSWTFGKALALEPVGPDGKAGPFSSSNDPQSS